MKSKAFTLIELLVVLAIVGILSSVGVVAYNGYTKNAKAKTSELNLYGFASDQSPRKNKANYWGMFLNNYVPIHTGAETIAKKYNMAVVFMDVQKIKRGYYEVSFVTITEEPKKFSDFEITERFIELLEKQIINKPEYYTWTHKRFKHRKTISN